MSDASYQLRNSQNLEALIANITGIQVPQIEYKQAGGVVLLGKAHNQADLDNVNKAQSDVKHEGKIGVLMDRANQKLIMHVDPNKTQTSDRSELQQGVERALLRMTIDIKKWPVEFVWSNPG